MVFLSSVKIKGNESEKLEYLSGVFCCLSVGKNLLTLEKNP